MVCVVGDLSVATLSERLVHLVMVCSRCRVALVVRVVASRCGDHLCARVNRLLDTSIGAECVPILTSASERILSRVGCRGGSYSTSPLILELIDLHFILVILVSHMRILRVTYDQVSLIANMGRTDA